MVEKAFSSVDNYLNFFKEIDDIYEAKENALNAAFAEINSVYGHLLQDDEIKKPNEFLVPEIPKNKKELKEKQESIRASRKNTSTSNETVTTNTALDKTENMNDGDAFRRSSRIASKKILPALSTTSENKQEASINASTSFVQLVGQSKRNNNDTYTKMKNSESTEDSSMMCLAHSTPLVLSPNDEKDDTTSKTPDAKLSLLKNVENSDSVKERIKEFEKRAAKNQLPSKLPLRTPDKKNKVQEEVNHTDTVPVCKNRLLRSNRVLQEKNMNIENKKPAGLKFNNASNKVKTIVRGGKTTNQRQNENNPSLETSNVEKKNNEKLKPPQKKYFNQVKKIQKLDSNLTNSQNDTCTSEVKQIETKVNKADPIVEAQYKIDHVSENESSEDEDHPKRQIPSWATKEMREYPLNVQAWINKQETVYPWFYNKNIKNPKSEELFSIATKMRPRTSSAVWNNKSYFK